MKKFFLIIVLILALSCAREKPIVVRYVDYTDKNAIDMPLINTEIDTVIVSTDMRTWKVEIHKKIHTINEDTV